MKILVLQETDWELRGPHQQHHLMERLSAKGHIVKVVDYEFLWRTESKTNRIIEPTRKFKATPKIIEKSNIEIIRPAIIKLPIFCYLSIPFTHTKQILNLIKTFKPDIIIGFGILNCYIGVKLAKKFHIPFVYYLIDHLHTLLPIKNFQFIAKIFEKKTLKNCDQVFAINHGLLDYSVEMGAEKEKGVYIPGGVDIKKFSSNLQRRNMRLSLGIKNNETVLMFMGWIYEFSGLKEIADYIYENEDDLDNIRLLIVGKGDLYEYIFERKQKLKEPNKIILTGQVPFEDIPKYLQVADYCLLPAHRNKIMENIVPIKLYEYLASGKPVICTKLKGIYKEFGENNGIIYINSPNEVFKAVEETRNLKNEISEKGIKFVSKNDWEIIASDFEIKLNKLVENNEK
ncbi:MAG: glycosyltransferase [Candidatus Heimdallarchaeaceae archaeon]